VSGLLVTMVTNVMIMTDLVSLIVHQRPMSADRARVRTQDARISRLNGPGQLVS
jgi:hypothetical protein